MYVYNIAFYGEIGLCMPWRRWWWWRQIWLCWNHPCHPVRQYYFYTVPIMLIQVTCLRVLAGVAAYFVIGAVIMKVHYKKNGTDLVINKLFWFALPGLIKVWSSN